MADDLPGEPFTDEERVQLRRILQRAPDMEEFFKQKQAWGIVIAMVGRFILWVGGLASAVAAVLYFYGHKGSGGP